MYNKYAGNISDTKDNQLIYKIKYNERPYFNISSKHILYTETKPTPDQIAKLSDPHITIIYSPTPDTAIIRHKQTRFTSTRNKTLWSIIYNQPTSVTFQYYDYNLNYPASIHNIQHILSTHNVPTKLIDLTLNHTLTIPPCATGTEEYIPDLNYQLYTETLYPYFRALRKDQELQHQLAYRNPTPVHPDIISFVQAWAPAYDIDLPKQPTESIYNFQPEYFYNNAIMVLYNQIKTYHHYNIEISFDYTICPICNNPFRINNEFCPHCATPLDDEIYLELD